MTTRLRVILAEDDVLLREGVASLLTRSGFDVLEQAGDATTLLDLVRERAPDLVMVDIRMPPTHTTEGLDAARAIRDEFPEVGILVLSAHADVEHAMELLASGRGIGYLLKSRITDVDDFIDTLQRIAAGRPSSTPRWCRSWSPPAGATTRSPHSVRGSGRYWPSWRKDVPMPASPAGCGSPRAPSRNTYAASSPN